MSLGSTISREAFPLTAVLLPSATPMQVGVLAAGGSAAALVFGVPAELLVDHLRRRPLMFVADLAHAVLPLPLPLATALGRLDLDLLLVISFVVGAWSVMFDVAYPTYLPTLVPKALRREANRRVELGDWQAEIGGAAPGGLMAQQFGGPLAVMLDRVSLRVSTVSLALIWRLEPQPAPDPQTAGFWREALGLGWLRQHPVL